MTHDFGKSLALSESYTDAPWWEQVYREAFPTFRSMEYVTDRDLQSDGVDRRVNIGTEVSVTTYLVDEKVRTRDTDDILLEYWSVWYKDPSRQILNKPGWVAKSLRCHYIAYAFVPSQRCYLLPFGTLRRAWKANRQQWVKRYKQRPAENRDSKGGPYETHFVTVPIPVLMAALGDAMLINWSTVT